MGVNDKDIKNTISSKSAEKYAQISIIESKSLNITKSRDSRQINERHVKKPFVSSDNMMLLVNPVNDSIEVIDSTKPLNQICNSVENDMKLSDDQHKTTQNLLKSENCIFNSRNEN